MAGQREEKKKSGAKHEIQGACLHSEENGQRWGSVRACMGVRAYVCVCVCTVEIFGNHKTKLRGVKVTKQTVALGASHGEASLFINRPERCQVRCRFSPPLTCFRSFEGTGWHPYSLVNMTG